MNLTRFTIQSLLLAVLSLPASAGTLTLTNIAFDDGFTAYLSTDDSVLGTLFATIPNGASSACGNNGHPACGSPVTIAPLSGTYYLHIVVQNVSGAGGWGGEIDLSDPTMSFANGSDSMITGNYLSDWRAAYGGTTSSWNWTTPTDVPALITGSGAPWGYTIDVGIGMMMWDSSSSSTDQPGSATQIWGTPPHQCQNCSILLSTTITTGAAPTPEPSTWMLLGSAAVAFFTVRPRLRRIR